MDRCKAAFLAGSLSVFFLVLNDGQKHCFVENVGLLTCEGAGWLLRRLEATECSGGTGCVQGGRASGLAQSLLRKSESKRIRRDEWMTGACVGVTCRFLRLVEKELECGTQCCPLLQVGRRRGTGS